MRATVRWAGPVVAVLALALAGAVAPTAVAATGSSPAGPPVITLPPAGSHVGDALRITATVTREAMAAFLYRAAGSPAYTPPVTPRFSDVPASHPFYKQISWLAAQGISTGYADGTFKPTDPVTREAMAAFLKRADPIFHPAG